MPAGPGAVDGNGIYQYGEADTAAPLSDLLNLGQGSTSTQVGLLKSGRASDVAASVAPWSSYTPVLSAVTTNPGLGTGPVQVGKFKVVDKVCTGWANITAGTGTVTPGSGTYRMSLPVTPVGATYVSGTAVLFDASSSTRYVGALQIDVAGALTFAVMTFDTMTSEWGSAGGPIIINTSDFIRVSFCYEAL